MGFREGHKMVPLDLNSKIVNLGALISEKGTFFNWFCQENPMVGDVHAERA